MGLLLDGRYWGNAANKLYDKRPLPGQTMPLDDAISALKIACRAMSDLEKDKDLEKDLAHARELASKGDAHIKELRSFADEFLRAEREVLWQSGIRDDVASDILSEFRDFSERLPTLDESFQDFKERISSCAAITCQSAKQEAEVLQEEGTRSKFASNVWKCVKGLTITAADGTALIAAGPPAVGAVITGGLIIGLPALAILALVGPTSIRYGTGMFTDAVKEVRLPLPKAPKRVFGGRAWKEP
jgi:hypothetical protein